MFANDPQKSMSSYVCQVPKIDCQLEAYPPIIVILRPPKDLAVLHVSTKRLCHAIPPSLSSRGLRGTLYFSPAISISPPSLLRA